MIGPLRRSLSVAATVPMLALGLYALFSRGTPWRGEWAWTLDWATGSLFLLGPIMAGCAAYDTATWRKASRALLDATVRGPRARGLPMIGAFVVGLAVYVVVVLVAVVSTVSAGARPEWDLRLLVLAGASAAAAVGIGGLLGWVWPTPFVAPVAVIVVFASGLAADGTPVPAIFRIGGTTGTLVGLTLGSRFFWSMTVLSLLVAAACVAWVVARGRRGRLVAVAVTVVLAGTGAAVAAEPPERLVTSSSPLTYVCRGHEPSVCLAEQTQRLLVTLPTQLEVRAKALRSVGITPPSRFTQVVPGRTVPSGAPLYLEQVNAERLSPQEVDQAFATPSQCAADVGATAPPQAVFEARQAVAEWLAVRTGRLSPRGLERTSGLRDPSWLRRPVQAQAPWLRATYAQLRACRFDLVRPPR